MWLCVSGHMVVWRINQLYTLKQLQNSDIVTIKIYVIFIILCRNVGMHLCREYTEILWTKTEIVYMINLYHCCYISKYNVSTYNHASYFEELGEIPLQPMLK